MSQAPLLVNLAFVPGRPTGLAVYAMNVVNHLKGLNYRLLTSHSQQDHPWLMSPDNITSAFGKMGHARRLAWTQFRLPSIYKQQGASLLFSPIPEAPLWAHCQTVVTVHDLIPLRFPNWRSPLTFYSRYYLPQVISQAQHLIFNSESTLRDVYHFLGKPVCPGSVIPLAYDASHYKPLDLPRQHYFLYVGRHDPYKNLGRLLTAFSQIPTADTQLWIAGSLDSRFTPALQAQAQALGIETRVRFLSYVSYDDLPRLINQAVALVFPSLWEGFGLPVLEAMACGTPVITSNLASLPEVAGDAALLIDPYNIGELAEAMEAVVSRHDLWLTLQQAGLKRAKAFSWETTGRLTSDILQQYVS
jgi:glycosyltransferase involved in cell wall biosynthesis